MAPTSTVTRLLYLDTARGLAALSVMTWHFLLSVYGLDITGGHFNTPARIFWYGEADVIFFFIHSGFILAYTFTLRKGTIGIRNYSSYLLERIFRIYPLFLFILVLSFAAANLTPAYQSGGEYDYISRFWFTAFNGHDLLNQSLLVWRIPESANYRLIPQDWTLTVELLAGAAIPLLAYTGRKHLLLFVLLLVLLKWSTVFTTYILEFGAGVGLFLLKDRIRNFWSSLPVYLKVLIAAAAIAGYTGLFVFPSLFTTDIELLNARLDRLVVGAGCILVFIMLLSSEKVQKILSVGPLVYIGKICYSLYLIHQLLLFIAWRVYPEQFKTLAGQPVYIVAGVYLLFLGLVLLLSHCGYQWVEKPMIKIGKKLAGKFIRQPAVAAL